MQEGVIVGWAGLAALAGARQEALQMRAKRGTLPLTERWERGNRVFDKTEVEAWLRLGKTEKQQ